MNMGDNSRPMTILWEVDNSNVVFVPSQPTTSDIAMASMLALSATNQVLVPRNTWRVVGDEDIKEEYDPFDNLTLKHEESKDSSL